MDNLTRVAVVAGAGDPIADLAPGALPGYVLTPLTPARLLAAWPRPHLVHLSDPDPVAARAAGAAGVPLVASGVAADILARAVAVLSPDAETDRGLEAAGVPTSRLVRCEAPPAGTPVHLAAGPLRVTLAGDERDRGLIAQALRLAHFGDPRLRLLLADDGGLLIAGAAASERRIRSAQAAGVSVLALDSPAARRLVDSGRSGCIVPHDPDALAGAIRALGRRPALRARLAVGGRLAVRERWLRGVADGYALALGHGEPAVSHARAA